MAFTPTFYFASPISLLLLFRFLSLYLPPICLSDLSMVILSMFPTQKWLCSHVQMCSLFKLDCKPVVVSHRFSSYPHS